MGRRLPLALLSLAVFLSGRLTAADPPEPRTDRLSDPLPEMARARLGTTRLRSLSAVAFAPDGKTVVCGNPANPRTKLPAPPLCLVEVSSGKQLRSLPGTERWLRFVVSPDGRYLAGISSPVLDAGRLEVLDLKTGRITLLDEEPHTRFDGLVFTPDSRSLVSVKCRRPDSTNADSEIRLWDLTNDRKPSIPFEKEAFRCTNLGLTPDGRTLITVGPQLLLWEMATGKVRERVEYQGERPDAFCAAVAPDGRSVATVSDSGDVRCWEVPSGKLRFGSQLAIGELSAIAFSPDGTLLAVPDLASKRGTNLVRLVEVANGKERAALPTVLGVISLAFSPDGSILATGGADGAQLGARAVQFWDVKQGKEMQVRHGHEGTVRSLCFSADGRTILSRSSGESVLRNWNATTGKELASLPLPATTGLLAPDGRRGADRPDAEGTFRVWDLSTGKELRSFEKLGKNIMPRAFSPDGTQLAVAGPGNELRVWDLATGKLLETYRLGKWGPNRVVFSPDGTKLAAGDLEGNVWCWDRADGKSKTLGGQGYVWDLVFAPDNKSVIVLGSPTLWDTETGKATALTRTEHGTVIALAVSADGQRVAGGDLTGLVYVWDRKTGKELCRLKGHALGRIQALAFAPDGKTLGSGGCDTSILLWDLERAIKD